MKNQEEQYLGNKDRQTSAVIVSKIFEKRTPCVAKGGGNGGTQDERKNGGG